MRITLTLTLCAGLMAATIALLAPSAAACHDDELYEWQHGNTTHTEVVGVGATGIGVYESTRSAYWSSGCPETTYAAKCQATPVTVPAIGTPLVTIPEVRILGTPVVEETTVPAHSVHPGTTLQGPAPSVACLPGDRDVGVYAGGVKVGTDTLVYPAPLP